MATWRAESRVRVRTKFEGEARSKNNKAILQKVREHLSVQVKKGKAKEGEKFKVSILELCKKTKVERVVDAWTLVARSA